jgi:hypothetical protein
LIIASAARFGLAMLVLPEHANAQWSAAQKAACQGDAMRLCSQSMADPGQLSACLSRNSSKVSGWLPRSNGPRGFFLERSRPGERNRDERRQFIRKAIRLSSRALLLDRSFHLAKHAGFESRGGRLDRH